MVSHNISMSIFQIKITPQFGHKSQAGQACAACSICCETYFPKTAPDVDARALQPIVQDRFGQVDLDFWFLHFSRIEKDSSCSCDRTRLCALLLRGRRMIDGIFEHQTMVLYKGDRKLEHCSHDNVCQGRFGKSGLVRLSSAIGEGLDGNAG